MYNLYILRNNSLHIQRKNYFHSTNSIYLFNEGIKVFLFNQIVIKYTVNGI